ncbi:MAG: GFA family protein [Agarilytica sp.]
MRNKLGGCACGSYRYELDTTILSAFHCHCRHCQHASGTGHSSLFVVPSDAPISTGNLKYFDQTSGAGNTVSRGFCPYCGSPVTCKTSGNTQVIMFHASTLDDTENFKPTKSVFAQQQCSWDFVDPKLESTEN